MHRTSALLLATFLMVSSASAGEAISITNWILYKKDIAPPYTTAATGPIIALTHSGKVDSAYFSLFKPFPLDAGKSVTFSARLLTPSDFPKSAGGQLRIGLYGVTAGTSPESTAQTDLRGFVVMGGANGKFSRIELFEHATSTGPLILLAGLTNHATANVETEIPRGTESRVVITIAKKSADLVTISGFWGDAPFTFDVKPHAGDYTHIRALILMRGNTSGTAEMNFSNVKIRTD